jgi:hypothetical protein
MAARNRIMPRSRNTLHPGEMGAGARGRMREIVSAMARADDRDEPSG